MPTFSPVRPIAPLPALAVILWPGFVVAVLATAVLFALFDPQAMAMASALPWPAAGTGSYSLAFFLFWALGSLASGMTWLLLRPSPPPPSSAQELD